MSFLPNALSFLIYFLSAAISVLLIKSSEKHKSKILAFLGVLVPIIVATFRESGVDFFVYKDIYVHIHAGNSYPIEIGWQLLNIIAPTYRLLLCLSAVIFFGVSYWAIRKFETPHAWMSWIAILSVCSAFFYNGTRQAIASAFIFLGIAYFYKKKYIGFGICVILGTLFHKTAIIIILLLPLYWFVMKRVKKLVLSTVIMSAIALLSVPIIIFISKKLGFFSTYISDLKFDFSILFLFYTLPPLFLYAWKPSEFKDNKKLHFCLVLYFFVIPMQFLGMIIPYADRIMLYFRPMIAIAVPLMIQHYEGISKAKGKNAKVFYVFWFIFYHVIMGLILNENGMYPYINFNF